MEKIESIQKQIIEEFEMFENWIHKYEYIIELGKELPKIEQEYKVDENLIPGCQSRVWLYAEKKKGKVVFFADSDAIMTKGIIALLIRVFSGQNPSDITASKLDFIDIIGLKDQLSATRANGLSSMIKQMKIYALALNAK